MKDFKMYPPTISKAGVISKRKWASSVDQDYLAYVKDMNLPISIPVRSMKVGDAIRSAILNHDADIIDHLAARAVLSAGIDSSLVWTTRIRQYRNLTKNDGVLKSDESPSSLYNHPEDLESMLIGVLEGTAAPVSWARDALKERGRAPFLRWALCSAKPKKYLKALLEKGYREPSFGYGCVSILTLITQSDKIADDPSINESLGFILAMSDASSLTDTCIDMDLSTRSESQFCLTQLSTWRDAVFDSFSQWIFHDDAGVYRTLSDHPFTMKWLSPAGACLPHTARGEWPLHSAVHRTAWNIQTDLIDRITSLGGDMNSLDFYGRTPWMVACSPFSETGTEGNVTLMDESSLKWWYKRGADFSLPIPSKDSRIGDWMRNNLRPMDAQRMGALFDKYEILSKTRKEKQIFKREAALGKNSKQRRI